MAKIKDSDVTVVLTNKSGEIVNANNNILKGLDSTLGEGMLGYMTLSAE